MNKINYIFAFLSLSLLLLFGACAEEEIYGLDEFYDSFKIDKIYLNVDRNIFFEGDAAVEFTATAQDRVETPVELFDYVLVVNDQDTLPGKTFLPDESGQYRVKAISNELESNELRVWFVKEADIQELNLSYDGYSILTTEPWSLAGDFTLTTSINGFPVDITKSSVPLIDQTGRSFTIEKPIYFSEPGSYKIKAGFNNRTSEAFDFIVRPAKSYEVITIPIVYHFINRSPDVNEINRAISSYNRIFNNDDIVLSSNPLVNQWENPNWVNASVRFEMIKENPQGEPFEGYRVINTGNERIDTKEELVDLVRENNWDPNKYLNVYVSNDPYNISFGVLPTLADTVVVGLNSLGSDGGQNEELPPFIYNHSTIYNSNTLGQALGLYNTSDCIDDFCDDTYSYLSRKKPFDGVVGAVNDGGNYFIANDCDDLSSESKVFYVKNIMADSGVDEDFADPNTGVLTDMRIREVITQDQRERIRAVINYAINLPTPRNK